ncbi:hypothetical protein JLK41_08970 [Ectopseudomonas khazarica]|uniref:hypothetical protein n=1 Tax=Ectopseudomonas khazarica TaxID=2502979 RepID=UPI001AEFD3D1|nr:hypothetical protein [Pseudomonas khazarica]QTS88273.1 hypothetical protein JLK41_08970 [Pseudomonas khazarica]
MELTTAQQCALLVMLATSALACFIFYSIGLRTGRDAGKKQGADSAAATWEKLLQAKNVANEDLQAQLDARTREAMTLRSNIRSEADDHAQVERGLLNRLAATSPLSDEDHAVLIDVVAKLELAADTFAGLNAHDHARFSRHLQAQVLDMAERIKKAQANTQPHPDSELIDWLDMDAGFSFDFQTAHLYFDCNPEGLNPVTNSLREIVRRAMDQAAREDFDAADMEDAA